ncbi:MAG TPA: hypothetical protein VGE41_00295 [Verrucomicrobiae bacterium]
MTRGLRTMLICLYLVLPLWAWGKGGASGHGGSGHASSAGHGGKSSSAATHASATKSMPFGTTAATRSHPAATISAGLTATCRHTPPNAHCYRPPMVGAHGSSLLMERWERNSSTNYFGRSKSQPATASVR